MELTFNVFTVLVVIYCVSAVWALCGLLLDFPSRITVGTVFGITFATLCPGINTLVALALFEEVWGKICQKIEAFFYLTLWERK
jgi:hypothetical protein